MTNLSDKEVQDQVSGMVNNMCFDSAEYVESVLRDHRTLQQNQFRLIVDMLKGWEKLNDTKYYDLRNEQTVKMSKVMLEAMRAEQNGVDYVGNI